MAGVGDTDTSGNTRRASDAEPVATPGTDVVQLEWTEPAPPPSSIFARPDPSFLAHLIAMEEQLPQTRTLRRAAISDVEAAYRSVKQHNHPPVPPGDYMRRSI